MAPLDPPPGGDAAAGVRPARPADEPALRRLQSHLAEPSPDLLSYALAAGDALVSTAGGAPAGYLLAIVGDAAALDPPDARAGGDADRTGGAHVAELVVAPARRREGRATALLGALFDRLAPGERVTLAVAPDNAPALSLYGSLGFERIGREDGYFDGGPALVLAREVPDGREHGDGVGPP